jgi:hypothetical protein
VHGIHDKQAAIELALRRNANALTCARHLGRRFYGHDCVALTIDLGEIE